MSGVSQSTLDNFVNKIALAFGMTVAEFLDFQALNDYSFEDSTDEDSADE